MIYGSSTSGAATTGPLAPDVASQIYTWADRPSHAVVLRNAHLANISLLGGQTTTTIGLPIYQHGQRPCLFATIAGIIVSVTEKDHRWDYLIDDGTGVIDVALHERDVPPSIATLQVRHYGPSSSRLTLDEQPSRLVPTLEVGDLVQVTGKIWQRPLAKAGEAPRFRNGLDAHEVALLNDDPTAEARHNLRAHQLLDREYARPFEAPIESYSTIHVQLPGDVRGIFTERLADRFKYDLRRLGGLDEEEEEDRKPDIDTHLPFRRVPKAERLAARAKRTKARERATPLPSPSPVATPPTSQRGSAPSTPPRPHAPSRQLRTPSKLRDSQCNQSNFRLYVQQFLRDYCQRRWRSEAPLPPAFTIAFLMRVQTLRDLAERTVNGLLAGRKSREPREDKVKRLFEYCIRQLVQDGVLVIADEEAAWPFDGSHYGDVAWTRRRTRAEQKLLKQLGGGGRLGQQQGRPPQWADVSMPLQEDGCENTTTTRKRIRRDAEAYQYVTPLLLLVPLLPILAGGHDDAEMDVDVDWAVWKLKRSDQRWAHIGVDAVKEALTLIARRESL